MIKLQVIGNLGKDSVVNTVNGKTVINFSVAHTEKYRDAQGTQKERTTWVECAYWTDRTAVAPYLKKGTQVYVEGTPDVRTYQTNDGRQGAALSLRITNVQLLGSRNNEDGSASGSSYNNTQASSYNSATPAPAASTPDMAEVADDLPF
ncbi:single-stranded DNA-binding protein [Panacibacter ginsenosidivorans]|uniref:Single-stranded DNA-binding protein n=1 Tax=Panacibacter ginsenosidivorans TaxID=1813871 RepID=A0A5B8VHT8_9BACT|nr:single-stranded DNA-binding protein [Panacibacter ginsenosidivorans]QEC69848.1 single-stranded DNA-binding protein [Panacibacter ginsenosidivorans]